MVWKMTPCHHSERAVNPNVKDFGLTWARLLEITTCVARSGRHTDCWRTLCKQRWQTPCVWDWILKSSVAPSLQDSLDVRVPKRRLTLRVTGVILETQIKSDSWIFKHLLTNQNQPWTGITMLVESLLGHRTRESPFIRGCPIYPTVKIRNWLVVSSPLIKPRNNTSPTSLGSTLKIHAWFFWAPLK